MNDLDVLLVDDIQFLAGKEKSHETFFYIFNELVNNKKQICLTSDRHPTEIKGLEERLISRFSSGLSVGVDSPGIWKTSVAILKVKLEKQSVDPAIIDDRCAGHTSLRIFRRMCASWKARSTVYYSIQSTSPTAPGSISKRRFPRSAARPRRLIKTI